MAYATALDVFIIICSVLVFFALAEFALLSFLDVYIRRYKEKEERQAEMRRMIRNCVKTSYHSLHHSDHYHHVNGHRSNTRDNLLSLEDRSVVSSDMSSHCSLHGDTSSDKCYDWDTMLRATNLSQWLSALAKHDTTE